MRQLEGSVFYGQRYAGKIYETEEGDFVFQYDENYLKSENPIPLSYSLPLQKEEFSSQYLKGFFDGLLPEGWILNLATEHWKFHPIKDRYKLLLKTCRDSVGAVSVKESLVDNQEEILSSKKIKYSSKKQSLSKCLYCYEQLENGSYHEKCSKKMFGFSEPPTIYLEEEIIEELGKINVIQGKVVAGIQKKLTLDFEKNSKDHRLSLSHYAGKYILKPKAHIPHVPENEDLIIKLAQSSGIKTAQTGLILLENGDLALLSRRLDRKVNHEKLHMEDFCQILDQVSAKKYIGSYQKVGKTLRDYCKLNVPEDQVLRLFELVVFSYIVGNSDLHLKNLSVLHNPLPELSPAYDLLSFEIYQEDFPEKDNEMMALAINGKKNKLTKEDFDQLAKSLNIKNKVRDYVYKKFSSQIPNWKNIITKSFLSKHKQEALIELIQTRARLF